MGERIHLQEVCKKFSGVFLDNCAFSDVFGFENGSEESIEGKISHYRDKSAFLKFVLRDRFKNFYLTPRVFREIELASLHDFHFSENLKKKKNKRQRRKCDLYKLIEQCTNRQKDLVRVFGEEGKILELSSSEIEGYGSLARKYASFRGRLGLSEADFEFLLYGIVFAKEDVPIALVSNDKQILKLYYRVGREEGFDEKSLSFFLRRSFPYLDKCSFLDRERIASA